MAGWGLLRAPASEPPPHPGTPPKDLARSEVPSSSFALGHRDPEKGGSQAGLALDSALLCHIGGPRFEPGPTPVEGA